MENQTSINHLAANDGNPLLAAGVFRPFATADNTIARYNAVKKQGRIVIRLFDLYGEMCVEKCWFTAFGRKKDKKRKIIIDTQLKAKLKNYPSGHYSMEKAHYEALSNACSSRAHSANLRARISRI